MKRLSGFSLMEMMVVLLIMSIIAAASAPMISKKAMIAASEKSPWVWTHNGSIAYNLKNVDTVAATIGAISRPTGNKSRLYIKSKNNNPQISFGTDSGTMNLITDGSNITLGTVNKTPDGQTIAIGFNHDRITVGGIAIGSSLETTQRGAIAIGNKSKASLYSMSLGEYAEANGVNSIAIGHSSVVQKTSADGNRSVAIGPHTQATGKQSIAIGSFPSEDPEPEFGVENEDYKLPGTIASGDNSIAIGCQSTAQANSTALGYIAKAEGGSAIAVGIDSNTTSNYAIAIGREAKALNENSVAIGYKATTNATNQIMLGNGHSVTIPETGSLNVNSVLPTTGSKLTLGDEDTTVYIPGNLVVGGRTLLGLKHPKSLYLKIGDGNSGAIYKPYTYQYVEKVRLLQVDTNASKDWTIKDDEATFKTNDDEATSKSDRRLKNVGKAFVGGLEEIKKLEVFNYTFKKDPEKTPRVGVMAQDLQKIFPQAVFKGEDGFLRIRMEDMFYALVNAVKELDKKIEALKNDEIFVLKNRVDKLEKENKELKKQNEDFEKRLSKLEKKL